MPSLRSNIPFLALLFLFIAASCGNGGENGSDNGKDEEDKEESMEGMKEKDLSEHGFDLSIMVPEKDPNKGIRPAKFELDERGRLQVKAGKGFGMSILEGAPLQDMDAKKEDIKNMNQALETDFVKEEEGLLIYKHAIPGSEKEMFHFFLVHEVDGMDYVIESLAEGEFTEKQVKRMIESAKTLSPKKESA